MKDRVLVAITGGIGSGKTTLSKIIQEYGFKVFSCDDIYKEISKTSGFLNDLKKIFPFAIDGNGELNRQELARVVFNDQVELKKLNDFSHPLILSELERRIEQEKGIVFCEVPLLFEENLQEKFDYIFIMVRPLPAKIQSIVKRDGVTNIEALKRIENQFNYENLNNIPSNYFIIKNDEGILELKEQVKNLIKKIS